MSSLRINLLGTVRVAHQGMETTRGLGRSVKALLGYLALFRDRFHTREVLAGLFWGESSENRARSNLSTTLWRLRKVLEPKPIPPGAYLVTTPMGEIGFNRESDHWIDADFFENLVKPALAKPHDALNPGAGVQRDRQDIAATGRTSAAQVSTQTCADWRSCPGG